MRNYHYMLGNFEFDIPNKVPDSYITHLPNKTRFWDIYKIYITAVLFIQRVHKHVGFSLKFSQRLLFQALQSEAYLKEVIFLKAL